MHLMASDLTTRCGLSHLIDHVQGDILSYSPPSPNSFDAVVSWLVFLHLDDLRPAYELAFRALRPDTGRVYVEDYFLRRSPLSDTDVHLLREHVYCNRVSSMDEYRQVLSDCGFVDIQIEDRTDDWTEFCRRRADSFVANRQRHVRVHGEIIVKNLEVFFEAVAKLFEGGNLGGMIVTAKKP